jgi:anti-anti-sigma factor
MSRIKVTQQITHQGHAAGSRSWITQAKSRTSMSELVLLLLLLAKQVIGASMMSSDKFPGLSTTTVAAGPGRLMLVIVGELDIAVKDRFLRAALDALDVPGVTELVVELSRTSFMDASGAYALQRAQAAWLASDRRFSVSGTHGMVGEVLYLTGVADALGLPLRVGPRPHERRIPPTARRRPITACGRPADDDREEK